MRFVLIDRLVEVEPGVRATAQKTFRADEELFRDHFPGNPLVPGVLLTEAMAQTAGWLILATTRFEEWPQLAMVRDAKFRVPVRPGQDLRVSASLAGRRGQAFDVSGSVHVAGTRVATARLLLNVTGLPEGSAAVAEFLSWVRMRLHELDADELAAAHRERLTP